MSSSKQAIDKFTCSKGPIHSTPPTSRFYTGLTNLATDDVKKIPGKNLFLSPFLLLCTSGLSPELLGSSGAKVGAKYATSSVLGTLS